MRTEPVHGGAPVRTRQRLIDAVQIGDSPVLVRSVEAAGVGLDLTRASHVVHLDQQWAPSSRTRPPGGPTESADTGRSTCVNSSTTPRARTASLLHATTVRLVLAAADGNAMDRVIGCFVRERGVRPPPHRCRRQDTPCLTRQGCHCPDQRDDPRCTGQGHHRADRRGDHRRRPAHRARPHF
ncbi:helicase-related protein [[Kitasatospora] papulosa]|uniref:helicase-related protein n=1 Tax=[Kitasatospora] papulosa TaxID=1464011 RepID=UPI0036BDB380